METPVKWGWVDKLMAKANELTVLLQHSTFVALKLTNTVDKIS